MFVTKDRPGAGSQNKRDRTIENTAPPMEGHGSLRPFAEHAQGRREAAQVELKRGLRASEETLRDLIEASLQGVLLVTKEYEPLLAIKHIRTISDLVAETMTNWGVDTVFGIVGHSNLGLADAIRLREEAGKLR